MVRALIGWAIVALLLVPAAPADAAPRDSDRRHDPRDVSPLPSQVRRVAPAVVGIHVEIPLGKFVIPNPFGPFEEARFVAYMMRAFLRRETATIGTPLKSTSMKPCSSSLRQKCWVSSAFCGLEERPKLSKER